jgi:hypothetical protein
LKEDSAPGSYEKHNRVLMEKPVRNPEFGKQRIRWEDNLKNKPLVPGQINREI